MQGTFARRWLGLGRTSPALYRLSNGVRVTAPFATEIHHRNKRRGIDLLDQSEWLAVSADFGIRGHWPFIANRRRIRRTPDLFKR